MMSARRYLPRSDDHETASKTLDRQLLVANRRRHESERFDPRRDLRSTYALHVVGTHAIAVTI